MRCFQSDLDRRRFPVTVEITPPRQASTRVLFRRARALAPAVATVNVIQRPDRVSSLEASVLLRRAGLDPVLHLVNRGRPRAAIRAELAQAARSGIGAVLCLRGDHTASDRRDTPSLRETVAMAHAVHPHAMVGATLNPYLPAAAVFRNLWPKLEEGARFVVTQPVFELRALERAAETLKEGAPDVHLLPMLMPVFSYEVARRVEKRLRIRLPESMLADLQRGAVAAGWSWLVDNATQLAECPWVDGLAITTPTMDVGPSLARRLVACLTRVRVDRLARSGVEQAEAGAGPG